MANLSDALDTSNPVQDNSAGDDPMSMGASALNYALYVIVALAGISLGISGFKFGQNLLGNTTGVDTGSGVPEV